MFEFISDIEKISSSELQKKYEEIQSKINKRKISLREVYNTKLRKHNDNFRSKLDKIKTEGGAFLERRLLVFWGEYIQKTIPLIKEYEEKIKQEE